MDLDEFDESIEEEDEFDAELCFEHQARGNYLSFSGMIGSVEKVPLVEFQLYFLIFKPEFTWNYDGI